ncbi:MAG: MBL fold metallo-hydrolase [Zestosphaera sp.]
MVGDFLESVVVRVLADDQVMFGTQCLGHHGISLLVEAYGRDSEITVLIDTGGNGDVVLHNMSLMGVNPKDIDLIVLTHRHWDHVGGLYKVLEAVGRERIPIVAHPNLLKPGLALEPKLRCTGVPMDFRERVAGLGGMLVLTRDPLKLAPGLMTTGEVRRYIPVAWQGFKTVDDDFRLVDDVMMDDISVIAVLRDGIALMTGCSHSGIVNIVKHAVDLTNAKRVKAIVGGLHLIKALQNEVEDVVRELSQYEIDMIAAGHCTGFRAQAELSKRYGDKFIPLQAGMEITLR